MNSGLALVLVIAAAVVGIVFLKERGNAPPRQTIVQRQGMPPPPVLSGTVWEIQAGRVPAFDLIIESADQRRDHQLVVVRKDRNSNQGFRSVTGLYQDYGLAFQIGEGNSSVQFAARLDSNDPENVMTGNFLGPMGRVQFRGKRKQ